MTPADFFRLADRLAELEPAARSLAVEMLTPPPLGAVDLRRSSAMLADYRAGGDPPPAWFAAALLVQSLADVGVVALEPHLLPRIPDQPRLVRIVAALRSVTTDLRDLIDNGFPKPPRKNCNADAGSAYLNWWDDKRTTLELADEVLEETEHLI